MNLSELISGIGNKTDNNKFFQNMTNSKTNRLVDIIQLGEDGNIDPEKSLALKQQVTPRKFSEHLFGRTLTNDKQVINPETGDSSLETFHNFRPGFFNNLNDGMNENYYHKFNIENLTPSKKGIGYRIGEGLGTLARSLNGPLGDAYIAGTQGYNSAMERQSNRNANHLYKTSLEQQGINTEDINGFINDDTFKNFTSANYRNKNLEIKAQIAMAKDETTRAQIIFNALKNNMISPQEAQEQALIYGVDVNKLSVSNETRKTDSTINKDNALIENIKNPKPKVYITKKEGHTTVDINHNSGNKTGNTSPLGIDKKVRIKAPNGNIYNIPESKLSDYIKAGGIRL